MREVKKSNKATGRGPEEGQEQGRPCREVARLAGRDALIPPGDGGAPCEGRWRRQRCRSGHPEVEGSLQP